MLRNTSNICMTDLKSEVVFCGQWNSLTNAETECDYFEGGGPQIGVNFKRAKMATMERFRADRQCVRSLMCRALLRQ